MSDKCVSILEGSIFTFEEAEKFRKTREAWSEKDLAHKEKWLQDELKLRIEDSIDQKFQQVSDLVTEKKKLDRYLTTVDGKRVRSLGEALKNRADDLWGRNSSDSRKRALAAELKAVEPFDTVFGLENNQTVKSIRDIPVGSDLERQVFIRAHGIKEKIDLSKMDEAGLKSLLKDADDVQRLALALKAYNEATRQVMGDFGVAVRYKSDFVIKRRYDYDAFKDMSEKEFADFLGDKLDLKQTFGENATMETAAKDLNDFYKRVSAETTQSALPSANRDYAPNSANSMSRRFVFKNAEAEYDVFNRLSLGGLSAQLDKNAGSMAATAIKVSEFGYDPAKVLKAIDERLAKEFPGGDKGVVNRWRSERIRQAEGELTGSQNIVNGSLTEFATAIRFGTAVAKLGNALTTTVLDVVDNGRQVFYVNGDVFGGFHEYGVAMTKATFGMNKMEKAEVANQLGIILHRMSSAEAMRLSDGSVAGTGMVNKWINQHGNKAMNIANLLPWQTGNSKIASGLVGAQTFAKLSDKITAGKVLNKFELDTLAEYGFTKGEMALLGSGMIERTKNWSNRPIFTQKGIYDSMFGNASESHIAKVAGILGVSPEEAGRKVTELGRKYNTFVNDFVVRGTPAPELATRTAMFKGMESELARVTIGLATQFMDTPVAQLGHMVELAAKLKRINDGSVPRAMLDALPHSAAYLGIGIPSFFAADYAMSVLTNREPLVDKYRKEDFGGRSKIMANVIGRTSFVPFVFEMLEDQYGGGIYNETAMDSFSSPAFSTLQDMLKLAKPNDSGGLSVTDFLKRQGPTNSIPLRTLNQWSQTATGSKIWDTKQETFF